MSNGERITASHETETKQETLVPERSLKSIHLPLFFQQNNMTSKERVRFIQETWFPLTFGINPDSNTIVHTETKQIVTPDELIKIFGKGENRSITRKTKRALKTFVRLNFLNREDNMTPES